MAAISFILCADDFALTDRVSEAILTLLDERRLSATGAMTNRPGWPRWARELKRFDGAADLGLHLNLTCGAPLGPMPQVAPDGALPPLPRLLRLALASAAARAEIAAETERQIDAFAREFGRPPDFIDGHQHVHAMPGVRRAVIATATGRADLARVWLRDPFDSPAAIAARGLCVGKAAAIAALSAGFGREVRSLGFGTNAGFAGVAPFDPARDFSADLDRFLIRPGPRHLVMCHPGLDGDGELPGLDPVIASRPVEFTALRTWTPSKHARIGRFVQV